MQIPVKEIKYRTFALHCTDEEQTGKKIQIEEFNYSAYSARSPCGVKANRNTE